MSSCTRLVLINTHDPYALYRRSIGAQEPALRRRTGLWGAVGNLSEDGDSARTQKWHGTQSNTTLGTRMIITSSELLSRSVCAVARGGGSALEPAARAPSSDVDWARRDAGDSPSSPSVEQCAVSEAIRCVRQVQLTYQRPHGRGPRRGGHKEVVHQTVHRFGTVYRRRTDFHVFLTFENRDTGISYQPL